MGNIVGEGFPDWLNTQIDTRQKVYGTINKTNEELLYLNSRTGWCKLVSSVDIKQLVRNIPADTSTSKLASKFVLFNGTYDEATNVQKGGVWQGTGDYNNYAYGLGGTEFGLRPMPGITSANIKTETRGSLKTATINIKANSREQFDIIDLLYLRLGFNMLLEWGHSSYFDNNQTYKNEKTSLADAFLTKNYSFTYNGVKYDKVNYDTFLTAISQKREASNGNYDAIVGKVVNFNWTFTKDGTYDITLVLRSLGDVIESLKTNILLPGSTPITTEGSPGASAANNPTNGKPPAPTPDQVIKEFSNSHEIAKDFYRAQQKLQSIAVNEFGAAVDTAYSTTTNIDYYKQNYSNGPTQYYVRFGRFLELIYNKIIPNVDNDNIKLLKIDADMNTNIILLGSIYQEASDPRICIYKSTRGNGTYQMGSGCEEFKLTYNGTIYGKIMNIYFNMSWVLQTMDSLKDNKGKVNLYDILRALCDGWNTSTGNYNQLEPTIEEETNTIKITDQIPLPDKKHFLEEQKLPTQSTQFQIYGYNSNNLGQTIASFVRDFSFRTTITNEFANMITIGSTANGYVVGQDSTALSRMNNGLVDRFKETIYHPESKTESPVASSLEQEYKEPLNSYNEYVIKLYASSGNYPTWDTAAMDAFKSIENQLIEYDQANITLTKQKQKELEKTTKPETLANVASPNVGFLPFDLSLTIDGLSGPKIYQALNIDTSYLPSNYPTSLNFLIKGITHTIQNNTWLTQLETMAVPVNPFGGEAKEPPSISRRSNKVNFGNGPYFRGDSPTSKDQTVSFLNDVLKGLGISSPNQYQIQFITSWRQHEGGKASWNPFNSTKVYPGSKPYNYANVQSYPTREIGLKATLHTLNLDYYKNVRAAIKEIKDENGISKAMQAVNASPWGSKFNPPIASAWRTLNNLIYQEPIVKRTV